MNLLWFIIIGCSAGFLAGKAMKGKSFGLLVNLIVGAIGGVVGGWTLGIFGIHLGNGIIGSLITAFFGAALFLWVLRKIA